MANIPGISGFIQPGVFARDRVISKGVSIPGGIRIACIMGEGLREETIVSSAAGGGTDGNKTVAAAAGKTAAGGRFFKLSNAPVESGRTELRLNGSLLYGVEDEVDTVAHDTSFDYRIDPATGYIELKAPDIGDQDGKRYSASSLNTGDGTFRDASYGADELISVVDETAPKERWTIRCVGVSRDSSGNPIPGKATFTATGAVSGMLSDVSGSPYLFHSDSFTSGTGDISGNKTPKTDGFIVTRSADWASEKTADTALKSGDSTTTTTDLIQISGINLETHGQALAGDYFVITSGTLNGTATKIKSIEYDSTNALTKVTLETDTIAHSTASMSWEIRAVNLLVDNHNIEHTLTETSGADSVSPVSEGSFKAADVGRSVYIASGDAQGFYKVTSVTSSRRVRVAKYTDTTTGFPEMEEFYSGLGLAGTDLTFFTLEDNSVIRLGIVEGDTAFEVGDKFYVDVDSRVLTTGDGLEAKYIATIDLNDPEFFTSASDLFAKHGTPSLTNALSLGAQMAFENGAPGILAVQCKPPVPRRTTQTVLVERDSNGNGGFTAPSTVQADDLYFPIPRPTSGLRKGKPDADTVVNIFVVRDKVETQIFPNKVAFYNSQYANSTGQTSFVTGNDTSFSYTIVDTEYKVTGSGDDASLTGDGLSSSSTVSTFTSTDVDFDEDDVGRAIVLQKVEVGASSYTSVANIGTQVFGDATISRAELVIIAIRSDNSVYVKYNKKSAESDLAVINNLEAKDIQFYVYDASDTTNTSAALMLHKDISDNGILKDADGLKITYIDQSDSDFFDTNWYNGFESLESADCQIIVPLPAQNRSGIFRAAVKHAENMSTIANRKERVALIGAQMGVTPAALIGTSEIAIEDIGILEGIQGDDASEVLNKETEDLVNFKLSDNYTSNRCMYFFPDRIVRNVNGTNTYIDGFYIAACAAGFFSGTSNVAVPLTNKVLAGFSIIRDRVYKPVTLNSLGNVGTTVLQPVTGGGRVLAGRTTSTTGFVEDEEISVIFIRDRVKDVLRTSLRGFIGGVQSENTNGLMAARTNSIMAALVSQGIVESFEGINVERDKVDPRQINVFLRFTPTYPINYIFIDIEVGVL
tara:strand:- start:75 stop:3362 length:3288 start_codon:yes stop_codon:yes gene_type:complete